MDSLTTSPPRVTPAVTTVISARVTTLVGGSALAVAALLALLPIALSQIPAANGVFEAAQSAPAQVVRALALLVACLILAFGIRGEAGIVGPSIVGSAAFVALALAFPLQILASFVFLRAEGATNPAVVVGTVFQLLPLVAGLVAAVAVLRARVLGGFARWILLAYAVAQTLVYGLSLAIALSSAPNASQADYLVVLFYLAAIPPLLLLTAGISYAFVGRTDAVKLRVKTAYDTWRVTTSVG